jgi:Hom_end-associated Hint
MVEVKFQLVKRDFFWIGLIVVLLGVGFGYAYNSGVNPDIMGHSLEELEGVCLTDGTNCDVDRAYVDTRSDYSVCSWYSGDECPAVDGVQLLSAGSDSTGVRCCGKADLTCTSYGWTTYESDCNADCITNWGQTMECGTDSGYLILNQRRRLADCTMEYRTVTGASCSISCGSCGYYMTCRGTYCDYDIGICFVKDTKILMADGSLKNIEEIESGEKVMGKEDKENIVLHRIESVLGGRETYIINEKVESTGAHLYLTKDNKWKVPNLEQYEIQSQNLGERKHLEVFELEIGDILLTDAGEVIIESIKVNHKRESYELVFDLIVDGDETYTTKDGYISHSNIVNILDYEAHNLKSNEKSNLLKNE